MQLHWSNPTAAEIELSYLYQQIVNDSELTVREKKKLISHVKYGDEHNGLYNALAAYNKQHHSKLPMHKLLFPNIEQFE